MDRSEGSARGDSSGWRIDDLAHRAGVTVDTIRYYQREGLLLPAEKVGRTREFGPDHLARLEHIRDLQARRFSLAAIRALLDAELDAARRGLVEGIFGDEGALSYSLDELVERSGLTRGVVARFEAVGLLRPPAEFGRDAYDSTDLDVLRAVAELRRLGLPDDMIAEIASIYVRGVEGMQDGVLALFRGGPGTPRDPDALAALQKQVAASARQLLPLVTRIVMYVHQRTLQRLTLRALENPAPWGG